MNLLILIQNFEEILFHKFSSKLYSIKWEVINYAQKSFNIKEDLREWLNTKEIEYIKYYKKKVGWRNMANSDDGGIYY